MKYLFDTNIVLAFLRDQTVKYKVNSILDLTHNNELFIAIVTVGELWSLTRQNNWGIARTEKLKTILANFTVVGIQDDDVIQRYADIDAFSQNKLTGHPLKTSARNMGKNDLWIAASASVSGTSLITTDKDFDHLHGQFVEVIWINPDLYK